MLIMSSRSARPIVALARYPGPNTPNPLLRPMRVRTGPFTTMSGVEKCVDVATPWRLNAGSHAHSATASTTGKYSGRRSEEHTSELQSHSDLVCRLLLEKKKEIN